MNETLTTFGYPDTVVAETDRWAALVRPKQLTLGSLVLVETSEATSLGAISAESGAQLPELCARIEAALGQLWQPDKVNYLALMMVDPNVHFHVIPRYETPRTLEAADGVAAAEVADASFPKPPDLFSPADLDEAQITRIRDLLREAW